MKKYIWILMMLYCGLLADAQLTNTSPDLYQFFAHPSAEAKPWVYWFWMDGNVTKEGITADLEAMDRVGVGGVLVMNVGLRTPPGDVDFNSPLFHDMFGHAARECIRLGMKITLHQCDGWATAGGPWITPDRSMKMLVWNTVDVAGPATGPLKLKQPFTLENFYEDVAVLAVPLAGDGAPLAPSRATVNGKEDHSLFDDDFKTGAKGLSEVVAEFDEPQEIATVVFDRNDRWPYNLGGGSDTPVAVELSADGKTFKEVARLDLNVAIDNGDRFSLTASFPRQAAKAVRIRIEKPRPFLIPEIRLLAEPRVHLWEVKSSLAREREHGGETAMLDAAPWPAAAAGIDPAQIVDLTGRLAADGTLDWQPPPGRWRIIRTGMTSTAKHVAPRTNAGVGLEADKMSGEAIRFHWDSFAKGVVAGNNVATGNPIYSVHTDSWESQLHTWSSFFAQEFAKRRGYSMTTWLPVLASGLVVGSAEESERFLWDVRRTMADLIADNFYGALREKCHESGVLFQSEAAGRQMFMYDPLNYAAKTDIYVGEFWMGPDMRVDCKVAASAAHTYGRPLAAAEAFTAGRGNFQDHPFSIKTLGDHAFTVGINRYIVHRYCMQPFNNVAPGLAFGPYGINFERTQTWWDNGAKAWCEYVARCQALLQAGTFVADVIHYIGHDAPNYLGHRDDLWNPVPSGYDFDGCNLEILQRLEVGEDGTLRLPSGMRYRVLLLPNRKHMTLEAAREIERLVKAGATAVGPRPLRTPGLKDWQANDAELAQIADRVWGGIDGATVTENRHGKGRVVCGPSLESVLLQIAPPDFGYTAKGEATIRYIHRRGDDDSDFYFVANGDQNAAVDAVLRFRVAGKRPELWDAATGAIKPVAVWRETGGVTELPVHFDPAGSWFVVFREAAVPPAQVDDNLFLMEEQEQSLPIATNAVDTFTMALWLRSNAALELPKRAGQGGLKPAGQNYAVYPAPGHEVWQDAAAGIGISAGRDGLAVIGHGARYFMPLLVHAQDLSGWTHVAVAAKDGALSLYVNGKAVQSAQPPGRPLHPSLGARHARGVPPFKGEISGRFQSSEALEVDAVRSLMQRTGPPGARELPGMELDGPWTVSFPAGRGAPERVMMDSLVDWKDHPDEGVKYFSGTATYRTKFDWKPEAGNLKSEMWLDLGEVKHIAEVTLNGKGLGTLWKPPFRVDVSGALREGRNELAVKVTNLWPNRLIGDEKLLPDPGLEYHPQGAPWSAAGPLQEIPAWVRSGGKSPVGRTTFLLWKFYGGNEPLLSSGLLGPVRLESGE